MTILEQEVCRPKPLVSIGIPTYNRAKSLARALDSALTQRYQNIEILISDNASSDETENLCQRYVSLHGNIKYRRFHENLGPTENFRQVLKMSSGDFFMWLADDDFIEDNYVSECLNILLSHDDVMLAGGQGKWLSDGVVSGTCRQFNITSESPIVRVIRYIWGVSDNSIFYGLYRRNVALPENVNNCLAGDWFFVAGVLVSGKARTADNTLIYRSAGGTSISYKGIVRTLKLHPVNGWFPGTMIGISAVKEVMFRNSNFNKLPALKILGLALVLFFMFLLITGLYGVFNRVRYRLMTGLLGMDNYNKLKDKYFDLKRSA